MNKLIATIGVSLALSLATGSNEVEIIDNTINQVIIDLDFCSDVDDVVAVRMGTALDKMGLIDLKAMGLCTNGTNNIKALHGLLSYDGYTDLPIGTSALGIEDTSPYWDILAEYSTGEINAHNSVKLYRQILENNNDKIIIITTGYLTNIAELLKSESDEISNKTGKELVRDKVEALYITGGAYPEGYDNNFFFKREAIDAIQYVIDNCDTTIYFNSSNNGGPVKAGGLLQELDVNRIDPVSKALDAFGTSDGRAAWDPMTVWLAVFNREDTHTFEERVNIEIDLTDGSNKFTVDENGQFIRIGRIDDNYKWYGQQIDEITLFGTPFKEIYEQQKLEEQQ